MRNRSMHENFMVSGDVETFFGMRTRHVRLAFAPFVKAKAQRVTRGRVPTFAMGITAWMSSFWISSRVVSRWRSSSKLEKGSFFIQLESADGWMTYRRIQTTRPPSQSSFGSSAASRIQLNTSSPSLQLEGQETVHITVYTLLCFIWKN